MRAHGSWLPLTWDVAGERPCLLGRCEHKTWQSKQRARRASGVNSSTYYYYHYYPVIGVNNLLPP